MCERRSGDYFREVPEIPLLKHLAPPLDFMGKVGPLPPHTFNILLHSVDGRKIDDVDLEEFVRSEENSDIRCKVTEKH